MSYSRNFGMRGFENIVRDGRFRTPAASSWTIGEPVMLDPAAVGYLKQATAGAAATAGAGIAIYEQIQMPGVDPLLTTYSDFYLIPGGRYIQMVHGHGTKVWFKNTVGKTLYDGRTQAGGALLAAAVNVATLAIGAGLTPDGAGKYKVAAGGATPDPVWLTVEQVNPTTGVVEARFNF